MIQESMQLHGAMTLFISRANGDTETVYQDNLIVNAGFDFIADAIGKSTSRPSVMGYIALGTGMLTLPAPRHLHLLRTSWQGMRRVRLPRPVYSMQQLLELCSIALSSRSSIKVQMTA